METRDVLLYLGSVCVAVFLFLWTIYMAKKHCSGKTPAEKCKKYEKKLLKPVMMFAIAFIVPIGIAVMSVVEMCRNEPFADLGEIFAVLIPLSVFFTLWASRWNMVYTYDYIRYQPVFGKMRTYSYADVKFMVQILADLLVHVGNRWILIDAMQDWTGLLEYYRLWQGQNGKGRKKHEPKTKFGKAMQDGQVYILVSASIFIMVIVTVMCVCFGNYSYQRGEMDVVVFFVVCWFVFAVLMLGMVYILINKDKYPKFANVLLYGKRNPDDKRKRR